MAAEIESGFLIDGKVYEIPALWELDMDERRLLWEKAGYTQEEFLREDDETADEHEARVEKMLRHPGYVETMMTVAYQRGNPDVKPGKVRLVIGKTVYADAIQGIAPGEEEPDEVPLALTSEPSRPSASGPLDNENSTPPSSGNGGSGSETGSGQPASTRPDIGTMRSGTSSTLAPRSSAA